MPGDLHTHTNFSDGSTNIEELVMLANKAKLKYLAISDHDTAHCVNFAYENSIINNVKLIPATELTAFDEKRGKKVHILCYCPVLTTELRSFFELMADRRNKAALQSATELEKMYPRFKTQAALKYSARSGVIYKTHLISVLNECGYTNGIYNELYQELFGAQNGKVLHEPKYESVDTVLKLIENAKGVAVIAHPSVYDSMELVQELAQKGEIDGVEITHPRNTAKDKQRLIEIAQRYNLIVTGGSDFHGEYSAMPINVGSYTANDEEISKIFTLSEKRRKQANMRIS